jgi:hypothetical protein
MRDTDRSSTAVAERSDIDAREALVREPGMRVRRARRSPPRVPAGTWPVRYEALKDKPHVGPECCIPVSEAPILSEVEKGGIELLALELFRPLVDGISFGMVREEDRLVIDKLYRMRFGCSLPTALWLVPYMTELEFGRAERFELERGAADPNAVNLVALARSVLQRTRLALARAATYRPMLPSYVSAELTALFLKKFSYTRGGGPLGAMSADAIRSLLSEPGVLASYLRTNRRLAARFVRELAELDLATGTEAGHVDRQEAAPTSMGPK